MRLTIGWVLVALALAACETSGDVPAAGADTTPDVTQATAAVTTSTRPLYSNAYDRAEAPTTTAPVSTPAAEATITIENFSFGESLTVGVGDPLVVVNEDGVSHTWTADDETFDSGTLGSGESFEYAFDEAGEYSFFCEIHPGMTGTITVTG